MWHLNAKTWWKFLFVDKIIKILHKEVTKLSLSYCSPPRPACSDAEGLFLEPTRCVLALVSSIYHLPLSEGAYGIMKGLIPLKILGYFCRRDINWIRKYHRHIIIICLWKVPTVLSLVIILYVTVPLFEQKHVISFLENGHRDIRNKKLKECIFWRWFIIRSAHCRKCLNSNIDDNFGHTTEDIMMTILCFYSQGDCYVKNGGDFTSHYSLLFMNSLLLYGALVVRKGKVIMFTWTNHMLLDYCANF